MYTSNDQVLGWALYIDSLSLTDFVECSSSIFLLQIGYLPTEEENEDDDVTSGDDTVAMDDVNGSKKIHFLTSAVPLSSEAFVLSSILEQSNWFNVGLFYSGYENGPSRRDAFLESAGNVGVCVSYQQSIPRGLTQAMADSFLASVADQDIQVLVWIVSPEEITILLRAARLRSEQFSHVGSSDWNMALTDDILSESLLAEAESTIFIDDVTYDSNPSFVEYFTELNLTVS